MIKLKIRKLKKKNRFITVTAKIWIDFFSLIREDSVSKAAIDRLLVVWRETRLLSEILDSDSRGQFCVCLVVAAPSKRLSNWLLEVDDTLYLDITCFRHNWEWCLLSLLEHCLEGYIQYSAHSSAYPTETFHFPWFTQQYK